jgi:hypothetical protein
LYLSLVKEGKAATDLLKKIMGNVKGLWDEKVSAD